MGLFVRLCVAARLPSSCDVLYHVCVRRVCAWCVRWLWLCVCIMLRKCLHAWASLEPDVVSVSKRLKQDSRIHMLYRNRTFAQRYHSNSSGEYTFRVHIYRMLEQSKIVTATNSQQYSAVTRQQTATRTRFVFWYVRVVQGGGLDISFNGSGLCRLTVAVVYVAIMHLLTADVDSLAVLPLTVGFVVCRRIAGIVLQEVLQLRRVPLTFLAPR